MFTGIVESTGRVAALTATPAGGRLELAGVPFSAELSLGESVAVNGCCLTVVEYAADGTVKFDLLQETLRVTNLGDLTVDQRVNLERALPAGGRLSGHFVQGHVDCTSEVLALEPVGQDWRFTVALPAAFRQLCLHRGSICVDGMSLTMAELTDESFTIWITPHTYAVTNLQTTRAGGRVNLEFDLLAKYIQRLTEVRA